MKISKKTKSENIAGNCLWAVLYALAVFLSVCALWKAVEVFMFLVKLIGGIK